MRLLLCNKNIHPRKGIVMLTLDTLKSELKNCGYAMNSMPDDPESYVLTPNTEDNQNFPEVLLIWSESDDSMLELLIPIIEYDFKKNLLEVLKFVTLFNWESVPGKLIYCRESGIFHYVIVFPVARTVLTPGEVCMNMMSGVLFEKNILETLQDVIAGKYDADEALESMSELEECLMDSIQKESHKE